LKNIFQIIHFSQNKFSAKQMKDKKKSGEENGQLGPFFAGPKSFMGLLKPSFLRKTK